MITETHKGVQIMYSEKDDSWKVEDKEHGITFSRATLTEARTALDGALRRSGKGAFQRFKAWKRGRGWSGGSWELIEVTSLVEGRRGYGEENGVYEQAWITYPKIEGGRTQREKVRLSTLYADTPSNDSRVNVMVKIEEEVDKLVEQRDEIVETLDPIKLPDPNKPAA